MLGFNNIHRTVKFILASAHLSPVNCTFKIYYTSPEFPGQVGTERKRTPGICNLKQIPRKYEFIMPSDSLLRIIDGNF